MQATPIIKLRLTVSEYNPIAKIFSKYILTNQTFLGLEMCELLYTIHSLLINIKWSYCSLMREDFIELHLTELTFANFIAVLKKLIDEIENPQTPRFVEQPVADQVKSIRNSLLCPDPKHGVFSIVYY